MNCPVCKVPLVMSDRNGVEIDYCPSCRGVWLDRGELDKIIERINENESYRSRDHHQEYREEQRHDHQSDHDHNENRGEHSGHHNKKRKKENFLGDLFDF